jgi:hypothetical protein
MPRSALTHRDARGLLCDGCKLRFVDVGALKEHLGFPRAQLVNMTDPKLVERCPDRLPDRCHLSVSVIACSLWWT